VADQGYASPRTRRKFYEGLIRSLVAFAKFKFYWGGKQSDGATTAQHVERAKKNCLASQVITDQTFSDAPEEVPCPWELMHVWEWFIELDATRQNGMGIGPITHTELRNWSANLQVHPLPFEVRAIMAIDRAFLIHSNSTSGTKDSKG
jgi:hypothetical protein